MRISKFFLILLLLGLILRLLPVLTGNIYFGFDQGLDTILVKQLVVDHKINLVSRYSGLQGVLMGPLWTWFLAIPFAISSGNPASFTVFLILLSLVSSAATFFLTRKYLGTVAAYFATAWTLFAPIFVFNATVPASPHPLTFLFIFFLWFCYELFVNGKKIFWIPLLLLSGIFFQFEIGFALFILPTILVLIIIFKSLPNKYFLAGGILFAITFVPQILFDLRHQFLITHGVLGLFSQKENSLYSAHNSLITRFSERAWSFGDDFITMVVLVRHWATVGLITILSFIGWLLISKNKLKIQTGFLKILLAILGVFYIGFSFYPGPLWVWYRAGLPIVYVLLVAVPLGFLWEKIKIFRFLIIPLFLVIFSQTFTLLPKPVNDVAIISTQKKVLDYVYGSAAGQQFSYFAYTPPVYDYIWQYDFWFYGQRKYGYLPQNWQMGIPLLDIGTQNKPPTGNEKLFYLIIEPNHDRPWEPQGWVKNYIKTGKILETKQFPGDVIVEKRTNN